MPHPHRRLRAADVHRFVSDRCFAPAQRGLVGIELERLVFATADPTSQVDHATVATAVAAAGPLPGRSAVTFEPGGQLEVSSPPTQGSSAACAATAGDLATLGTGVEEAGLELVGVGLDPLRRGRRIIDGPRYRAMEAYFDATGASRSAGRAMMCNTASVQVNLDIGDEATQAQRWRLAHSLGPVLLAAFANSPFTDGAPNGLRSARAAAWAAIDPTRTGPAEAGRDWHPAQAWADYALAARVMLVRVSEASFQPLLAPLPFARWMEEGHELGYPTLDDLEYHLSTLFPPVRPKGWLELRMIDALPDPWWRAAVAVSAALLDDAEAAESAATATALTMRLWADAARHGLGHPALASAATVCFTAALDALPRLGADPGTVATTACFFDQFVARGRCPADDLLDGWRDDGQLLPPSVPLEPSTI
ncbi:MAG: ergothioneine biosynthesis glutamate--cysteine ligase EgtA [Acidimicrobiales bacterium]